MSNDLDIRATVTAVDNASPIINKLLAKIKKLESAGKSLNTAFSSVGRAGSESMADFDRTIKAAIAQLQGLANVSRSATRNHATEWKRVNDQRLIEARSMYHTLMRDERGYQSLVARRTAGGIPRSSAGPAIGRIAGGTFLGVGAASAVHQLSNSVVAVERSIGRGIVSAFRERLRPFGLPDMRRARARIASSKRHSCLPLRFNSVQIAFRVRCEPKARHALI